MTNFAAASALIADIGGTNARFALALEDSMQPQAIANFAVDDYPDIDSAIRVYLEQVGISVPSKVCIAIACPTLNDRISMTNNGWVFLKSALKRNLGVEHLAVINDYAAMAYAAPNLQPKERFKVGSGDPRDGFPVAVLGPGTGLGVSALVQHQGHTTPIVSEGGHVDFAPTTEQEVEILRFLMREHRHVSAERLLSGMGLQNIYRALAAIRGEQVEQLKPSEISLLAFNKEDPLALQTLDQFCAILGSVAGNTALTYGAQGGVFVTGGIIPRMLEFFGNSRFRERFEAKGRFCDYMSAIPTYVMTADQPGLLGAAAAARLL